LELPGYGGYSNEITKPVSNDFFDSLSDKITKPVSNDFLDSLSDKIQHTFTDPVDRVCSLNFFCPDPDEYGFSQFMDDASSPAVNSATNVGRFETFCRLFCDEGHFQIRRIPTVEPAHLFFTDSYFQQIQPFACPDSFKHVGTV
jgi:hypothetical protein